MDEPEIVEIATIYPGHRSLIGEIPPRVAIERHTRRCVMDTVRALWDRFVYEWHWPNYCRHCDGWGVTEYTENQSPIGSGEYWPMQMTEPCICLDGDEMVCPRCGTPIYDLIATNQELLQSQWFPYNISEDPDFAVQRWFDEMMPCPVCGWNWGKPPTPEEMAVQEIYDRLGIDIRRSPDALSPEPECYCWETTCTSH